MIATPSMSSININNNLENMLYQASSQNPDFTKGNEHLWWPLEDIVEDLGCGEDHSVISNRLYNLASETRNYRKHRKQNLEKDRYMCRDLMEIFTKYAQDKNFSHLRQRLYADIYNGYFAEKPLQRIYNSWFTFRNSKKSEIVKLSRLGIFTVDVNRGISDRSFAYFALRIIDLIPSNFNKSFNAEEAATMQTVRQELYRTTTQGKTIDQEPLNADRMNHILGIKNQILNEKHSILYS
jgi:hypothetical protein